MKARASSASRVPMRQLGTSFESASRATQVQTSPASGGGFRAVATWACLA